MPLSLESIGNLSSKYFHNIFMHTDDYHFFSLIKHFRRFCCLDVKQSTTFMKAYKWRGATY